MAQITLKVLVDDSQVKALQATIDRMQSSGINIGSGIGGATGSVNNLSKGLADANTKSQTLLNTAAKYLKWRAVGQALQSVTEAFSKALTTMKSVDSELVTIQKVTGASKVEMKQLGDATYEMASKYGRTADELLNISTIFARAGYSGEALTTFTEMGALLQNVGDISDEMAGKFMIAADAAFQLGGDSKKLMQIIDGMNEVTNHSAVDMQGLTEGMTVAGSALATAGEDAQTFTALLGTGIAKTQRTGSEVARGLRTIVMNVQQIKGELDDGTIIDEKSLGKAGNVLNAYGISVKDMNGDLRKTSDVLGDLAKKWDKYTRAQKSEIGTALAGKTRKNILDAILDNWDEYEKQMKLYANGTGSALEENAYYLDSWEAKSKQLESSWTEFLSKVVDTDVVKDATSFFTDVISGMTGIVDAVDFTKDAFRGLYSSDEVNKFFSEDLWNKLKVDPVAIESYQNLTAGIENSLSDVSGYTQAIRTYLKFMDTDLTSSIDGFIDLAHTSGALADGVFNMEDFTNFLYKWEKLNPNDMQKIAKSILEVADAYGVDVKFNSFSSTEEFLDKLPTYVTELGGVGTNLAGVLNSVDNYANSGSPKYFRDLADSFGALEENGSIDLSTLVEGLKGVEGISPETITSVINSIMDAYSKDGNDGLVDALTIKPEDLSTEAYEDYLEKLNQMNLDAYKKNRAEQNAQEAAEKKQEKRAADERKKRLENENRQALAIQKKKDEEARRQREEARRKEKEKREQANKEEIEAEKRSRGITGKGSRSNKEIDLTASYDDVQRVISTLTKLKKTGKIDVPVEFEETGTITVESLYDYVKKLQEDDTIDVNFDVDNDGVITITEVISTLNRLNGSRTQIHFDSDYSGVDAGEKRAEEAMLEVDSMNPKMKIGAVDDGALSTASDIKAQINNMVASIKISADSSGGSGRGRISQHVMAEGGIAKGGLTLVNEEGAELIQSNGKAWIAGSGNPVITDIPRGAKVWTAKETEEILNRSRSKLSSIIESRAGGSYSPYYSQQFANVFSLLSSISEYTPKSSNSNIEYSDAQSKEIKRLEEVVSLKESELSLYKIQDKTIKEQVDKIQEIRGSLKKQIEYLQSIGGSQEEINELTVKWYEYYEDIKDIQNEIWETLEESIDKELEYARTARDERIDVLQKEIDAIENASTEKEKQLELEERILAVKEAETALDNANNERTVRVFNQATGQWEYTTGANNIQDAQKSLDDARKALSDYQEQLDKEKQIQAIQAEIDAINNEYSALEDAWEDVTDVLQEPVMTIEEVLKKIANEATPDMLSQIELVNDKLEKFGYQIAYGNNTYGTYDSGGILSGLGGIKATAGNEIILPPDITSKMLSPNANGTFMERLGELRFLYGVTADGSKSGNGMSNYGDVHNGNVYKFGNITIGEDRARSMSVYDMVRMSRGLRIYSAC